MCLERTSLDNAAQTRIFYIRQLANRRANTAQTYDKAAHSPKHCSRYGVGWNGKNSFKKFRIRIMIRNTAKCNRLLLVTHSITRNDYIKIT